MGRMVSVLVLRSVVLSALERPVGFHNYPQFTNTSEIPLCDVCQFNPNFGKPVQPNFIVFCPHPESYSIFPAEILYYLS